jgi:uncharacterized membrane protein YidH (DUF202 family)
VEPRGDHRSAVARHELPSILNAAVALIVLGTVMIAIAAIRFLITAKTIDSDELHPSPGSRVDLALAALLVLLGCGLFVYLSHALVSKL